MLVPKFWIPLYTSVHFTRMGFRDCMINKEWQDKVRQGCATLKHTFQRQNKTLLLLQMLVTTLWFGSLAVLATLVTFFFCFV